MNDINQLAMLVAAAIGVPMLLAVATSFAKFAIVGASLRYAMGTPRMPPSPVIAGMALVFSLQVMWPVVTRIQSGYAANASVPAGQLDAAALAAAAPGPMSEFLAANSSKQAREMFESLREKLGEQAKTPPLSGPIADAISLRLPAFALTELTEAFMVVFLVCIPFLIIDLVVGSVLLSLGMHMLNPSTVSLPFKLLLFVLMDGWKLIVQGLILGYHYTATT